MIEQNIGDRYVKKYLIKYISRLAHLPPSAVI